MNHTQMLNQNYMFRRIYRKGKSFVTPYFALYVLKGRGRKNRLGITTTKKIGNAVQRNRARRVILEAYRLLEDQLPKGMDLVIVARKKAVNTKMQPVRDSLARTFLDMQKQRTKNTV